MVEAANMVVGVELVLGSVNLNVPVNDALKQLISVQLLNRPGTVGAATKYPLCHQVFLQQSLEGKAGWSYTTTTIITM